MLLAMDASDSHSSSQPLYLEARVLELETHVRSLLAQMGALRRDLGEKVSALQLDSMQQAMQSQLSEKALLADQMDDKLLALRFEQLDAKMSMLQQEIPVKAELSRLDQQLQSVQQVLSLEHLDEVRQSLSQLERVQQTSITEIDTVKKTVHQELGRQTADVMNCLEDGLQGLRREIVQTQNGCRLDSRSALEPPPSPDHVGRTPQIERRSSFDSYASHSHLSTLTQANEQELWGGDSPAPEASFAQLDLSLRLLQRDLSQKQAGWR